MERRPRPPSWRASLGSVVTAFAAVLLAIAVWQALALGRQAGDDVLTLQRERIALQYQQLLVPLLVDVERYRVRALSIRPQPGSALRAKIDREFATTDRFTVANDEMLQVLPQWRTVRTEWTQVRGVRYQDRSRFDAFVQSIIYGLIYRLEDVSGLQYEVNRDAQDLADIAFSKLPLAVNEVLHAELYGDDAQTSGAISIPERIHLAGLLSNMNPEGGNFDLLTDDWDIILSKAPGAGWATASQARRYAQENAAFRNAGSQFRNYVNAHVVLHSTPSGKPQATSALADRAVAATIPVNAAVDSILDRQLSLRLRDERLRNRYIYFIVLLGAVLLIGIMLLVAEFTARRHRELLAQAQSESARLSAELARRNAERALRMTEAQFRAVFDGAALGIAVLDRAGAVLDANAVFRNIYGVHASKVLDGHEERFAQLMRGESDLFEFEAHVMTPGGQEAWTDCTVSLVLDEGGAPHFAICMFRDLTELKRSERRMQHDLMHDALTGLPNRANFESRLREHFGESQTSPEASFAVLLIDLDRFKDVNESLGRDAGDFVIAQAAARVRSAIEDSDAVARVGSDEFGVLVRSLPDVLNVALIARRILSALAKPIVVGERSIFVSASVGIAVADSAYRRPEDIIRDADIAARYAKGGGGGRFALFDSKMHARAEKRLQLTTDLRLALDNNEFDQLYQPIISLADGALIGCEALLRWNHPIEGVMSPAEFMPLAEQTGLAVPIGRFVIRSACRQMAQWKRGANGSPLHMNVNISAAELFDPDFEAMIQEAVREFGVDPQDISLEITESVVLDESTRPSALFDRLRNAGFQICIDDFGTGYSSLRYLQQFRVDSIKIDRSFVSGQDGDVASEPIVRTLMTLAEAFDVRVVAEGIETQRQRDVLRNVGCRFGQGYLYAPALSADELMARYPATFGLTPRHATA